MSYDKITVVINTFNSEDKIRQCLNSIDSRVHIIIIENSNNSSFKDEIEKEYSNVNCFLTGRNLGYAKGNNLGLSKVKSDYALILNPDAFLEKDTLDRLLSTAFKFKDFSIIGPAKQDEFSNSDINDDKADVFNVKTLKGFAMFFNLKQFEDIGFFDENFFIYFEEIDLCKRLIKDNKKIFLDTNIRILHDGGASHENSINYEMEKSRNWHWMWSTFYFHKKHNGFLMALFIVLPKLTSAFLKSILFTVLYNKFKREIYISRLSGLVNSILGRKSWNRPSID